MRGCFVDSVPSNKRRNTRDSRNSHDELNELLSEFILSVRTKEGQEYEPSSLREMVASFERHLKRKSYPVSIINDVELYQKTHSFAALTRSFSDTTQLVNKNRAFSME